MNFRHFIDFDRELNREPNIGGDGVPSLAERDRALGRAFAEADMSSQKSDEHLFEAWRNGVSKAGEMSLGDWVARAARFAAAILFFAGWLFGWGAAAALLRYDGSQPINVLVFFFFLIGLQLLLLPPLVSALISPTLGGRLFGDGSGGITGWVFELTTKLFSRSFGKRSVAGRDATPHSELGALRAHGSLYREVHPTLLLLLGQVFGVAFNIGVVLSLLVRVLFSDLTFAWSTTLQVSAARVHELTTLLSMPWAWLLPDARPSIELVEATRYVRMDGSYVGTAGDTALLAGAWWPFLLASALVYGLLPRLLAFSLTVYLLRRRMNAALVLSARVRNLQERLKTPRIVMRENSDAARSGKFDEPAGASSLVAAQKAEGRQPLPDLEGRRTAVIHWGYDDLPSPAGIEQQVARFFGGSLVRCDRAGNPGWNESALFKDLSAACERGEIDAAVVFFEPFEPPKEDVKRFLRELRKCLGKTAPVVVVLAEYAGEERLPVQGAERRCWEKGIQQLGDPLLVLNNDEAVYG